MNKKKTKKATKQQTSSRKATTKKTVLHRIAEGVYVSDAALNRIKSKPNAK